MIAYDSNEDSLHTGVVRFIWYAADSAHALGQLSAIDYSDSTPDVAYTYDRLGRPLTITDVLGTRTNTYSATSLLAEHLLDGTTLARSFDPFGREAGISLGTNYEVDYGYDSAGRFSTVAVSNGATFTYSYVPNTSLLAGYTNDLGLAVAYEYEPFRDHKTLVSNAWGTNTISTFAYTYDALGRRTARLDDGLTTNLFGYNPRSELTSAEMGTNTYSYAYDPIGNRLSSSENGTTTTYAANELNQYTALNPTSPNPTPFTYDADGNMTQYGDLAFFWDAENRLIGAASNGPPLVTNRYDFMSRRIEKGTATGSHIFLYDGWSILLEKKDITTITYFYGLDIGGLYHDVGNIGALLMTLSNQETVLFGCDDLGNITGYVNLSTMEFCPCEYDPFGSPKLSNRESLKFFIGFHTKPWDDEVGLYDYGYRFRCPAIQKWISRDPIGERADFMLYSALKNDAVNHVDAYGLSCWSVAREGFNTPDEKRKIEAMQNGDPSCAVPKISCKCFCPGNNIGGTGTKDEVTLCWQWGRSDAEYRVTRAHELSHAFDQCKGARFGCYGKGLEQRICSELRAYTWANGYSEKQKAVTYAVSSVKARCDENYGYLYRAMADALFEQCSKLDVGTPIPDILPWGTEDE